MPIIVPPIVASGGLRFKWKDPLGVIRNLTYGESLNLFVPVGSQGLGMPEFDVSSSKFPLGPGSFINQINTNSREITLPIVNKQTSLNSLVSSMEDLHGWFDTGDEEGYTFGYLQVYRPDDTARQIGGVYRSGLEGDTNEGGPDWIQYEIELFCPDPYPTDLEDTVVTKTVAQAASFILINQGRRRTYPIWRITGPFSDLAISNTTVIKGTEGLGASISLAAGETIVIDTRPSELRPGLIIYKEPSGTSLLGLVTPASTFFYLQPGQNNLAVIFGSGTTASTTVELTYLARHRSLLR